MHSGIFPFFVLLLLITLYFGIIILAGKRLIRCSINEDEKLYWFVSFILLSLLSMAIFILYHDYFLDKGKRAN